MTQIVRPCTITPADHDEPPPPESLECGHCDGHISAGMFVDHCTKHGWLCERCTLMALVAAP